MSCATLCPAGLGLSGVGDGQSRLSRDGYSFLATVTHAHQDGDGKTMSIAEGHISMLKSRVDDVGAINAEGFAFVTRAEDGHGLNWQISCGLMVARFTQSCQHAIAEDARTSDGIATLLIRKLQSAKGIPRLR